MRKRVESVYCYRPTVLRYYLAMFRQLAGAGIGQPAGTLTTGHEAVDNTYRISSDIRDRCVAQEWWPRQRRSQQNTLLAANASRAWRVRYQ